MKFFNIGPLELVFIVLIALIILGPTETLKTIRSVGKWVYKFVRSPYWQTVLDTQKEIRDLPTKLVRESGLDESLAELKKETSGLTTGLTSDIDKARKAMKVDEINVSTILPTHKDTDITTDIGSLIETKPDASVNNTETTSEE